MFPKCYFWIFQKAKNMNPLNNEDKLLLCLDVFMINISLFFMLLSASE